jgi:hypothetical protein
MKTYKGRYSPKNPGKYKGDPTGIIYRSLWERKLMVYLDENKSIIQWSSEEIAIPYISPIDNRYHRYFPDFYIKAIDKNGNIVEQLLEVKPKKETIEPTKKKRITKQYITEVTTWGKNQAKWKAATEYCLDRGWQFKLITEKELGLK